METHIDMQRVTPRHTNTHAQTIGCTKRHAKPKRHTETYGHAQRHEDTHTETQGTLCHTETQRDKDTRRETHHRVESSYHQAGALPS